MPSRKRDLLKGDVTVESVIWEEAGEPGTIECIERGYKADFAARAA